MSFPTRDNVDAIESFVEDRLGVPRDAPEFNSVLSRAAWPVQNTMYSVRFDFTMGGGP
jgi:hypothetical protein